jgi:hypothetical protein
MGIKVRKIFGPEGEEVEGLKAQGDSRTKPEEN